MVRGAFFIDGGCCFGMISVVGLVAEKWIEWLFSLMENGCLDFNLNIPWKATARAWTKFRKTGWIWHVLWKLCFKLNLWMDSVFKGIYS